MYKPVLNEIITTILKTTSKRNYEEGNLKKFASEN